METPADSQQTPGPDTDHSQAAAWTRVDGSTDEAMALASAPEEANETSGGTLRFDIARLTLPWLSGSEQARFAKALETELRRLGDKRGRILWTGATDVRIDTLNLAQSRASASPEELARHIGQHLIRTLTGLSGVQPDV